MNALQLGGAEQPGRKAWPHCERGPEPVGKAHSHMVRALVKVVKK